MFTKKKLDQQIAGEKKMKTLLHFIFNTGLWHASKNFKHSSIMTIDEKKSQRNICHLNRPKFPSNLNTIY